MKIWQAVQKLLVGDRQTDSQFLMIEVTFNAYVTIQNFIQIQQSVQKVHPTQKFKRSPLWTGWSYQIKEYDIEVAFNVITSIQNFI
jgi:hypothetical protein